MKDQVLIRAKELAKQNKRDAIHFLASEASKYTVHDDLFFKYFLKCVNYMLSYSDLTDWKETLEDNFNQLFEVLDKEKIYNENYRKVCDYLFQFNLKTKNPTGAFTSIGRLSKLMYKDSPISYLLVCQEMSKKSEHTSLLYDMSKTKYQGQYLYFFIQTQLLIIGWHLHVTMKQNISEYQTSKINALNSICYWSFEVFNNIRNEFNKIESLEKTSFDEITIKTLRVYFSQYSDSQILERIKKYLFIKLPEKMKIQQQFLEEDFDDIITFGNYIEKEDELKNIFFNKGIDNHISMFDISRDISVRHQSLISISCDKLANEFINKYKI